MKKSTLICCAIMAICLCGSPLRAMDWMVGFWFGVPEVEHKTETYGIRLGLPGSSGGPVNLSGMELSIFCSSTEWLDGFQWTLCGPALAGDVRGCQLSLYNRVRNHIDGVQVGVVNGSNDGAGIQIGLVNYAKNNAALQLGLVNVNPKGFLPFMILINFGSANEAN